MSPQSRITELQDIITKNNEIITSYFDKHNLPALSFDKDGPPDFPVPSSEVEIQKARRAIILATQEMHDLMVGPREQLRWMSWDYNINLSLHAIYQFKIAQNVPLDTKISYDDLSKLVKLSPTNTRRIIRYAITRHIFCEPVPNYVTHSAASKLLLDDDTMREYTGANAIEFFPAAAHTVESLTKYHGSEEPTETGWSLAHSPNQAMFAKFGQDPVRAKRMGMAMTSLTGGEGYELKYLVEGYPWGEIGEGVVVDIGGSFGFVCVALAQQFPLLKFVVQDLPKTVADAPSKCPPDLLDRIQFQAHDFYTPQPVHGADVYFFRWVCHNQSDKYGVKMLQQLVPALKPGARIVIHDNCLPEPGTVDNWDDNITRSLDLIMLALLNAKERDDGEWKELFKQADPRFKYKGAKTPKGSRMSIMEAVWEP